jgi:hypothetical protein
MITVKWDVHKGEGNKDAKGRARISFLNQRKALHRKFVEKFKIFKIILN